MSAEQLNSLKPNQDTTTHRETSRAASDEEYLNNIEKKAPIEWPPISKHELWEEFDYAVSRRLTNCFPISKRITLLETVVYEVGRQMFGVKAIHNYKKSSKSYHIKQVQELVKIKNQTLLLLENGTTPEEACSLNLILSNTREKLRKLRKSNRSRKARWRTKQQRAAFIRNPFQAAKDLLSKKVSTPLAIDKETLDKNLKESLSDPMKGIPIELLSDHPEAPPLLSEMSNKSFRETDYTNILSSRRNGSKPGPNGIPYKVYKKCPRLQEFLWTIILYCQRKAFVPIQWKVSFTSFIPKVDKPDPSNFGDYRSIALLNVEGKLFFSLVSKRLVAHVVHNNKFINTSVQKGCMEKVPGCVDHISMVWDALSDAKINKKSLSIIWLDIANAYGSIPHHLIFLALRRYGIHDDYIKLLKSYYNDLNSKSVSDSAPSSWHSHERGIFAGCTVSCHPLSLRNEPPIRIYLII